MIKLALIGNPNTGKTTLFNSLSKSNEHTGNWHGVTVDEKHKKFKFKENEFDLVDLPGVYSLTPLSYDEEVAIKYIYDNMEATYINIIDVNNVYRGLYLTLQLMELGVNVILFFNTMGKKYKAIDLGKIKKELGVEIFCGNADNVEETELFKDKLIVKNNNKIISWINTDFLQNKLPEINKINKKYVEIKYLEQDKLILEKLCLNAEKQREINELINFNSIEFIAKKRFNYINYLLINRKLNKNYKKNNKKSYYGFSFLDKILLNKFLCLPIFFMLMMGIFYLTFFSFGAFLSQSMREFIENVAGKGLVDFVNGFCSVPWICDLVEIGIVGGVGSLVAFLPQVCMLFFFLSVMEDSGYMSRIAFCFEDIFSKLGLSGKSVYTLLMGFGCSATACMTARNMEDKNAKIKTAMLTPYMSCSAKLPIYAVIGGAFFGEGNIWVVFSLYLIGVVVAVMLSMLLEKTVLKSKEQSFIMEFPQYRLPSIKRIFKIVGQNSKMFLIRIGSLLISVNIIVWVLSNFSFSFVYVTETGGVSMLERLGTILAPVFKPLGFGNWGAVSALIAGLVAKEIIISSIAMFNGISMEGNSNTVIQNSLFDTSNAVFFTPASAISYLVFCLLYCPCIATMSVLFKEIGKKWTIVSILIELLIAYLMSFLVFHFYDFVSNFGILKIISIAAAFAIICLAIFQIIKNLKQKQKCAYCVRKNCF